MDVTSTRLNAMITDALTPQPLPSAKADPATTALIKALVQPPAPAGAQAAQFAAQALSGSLQAPPARSAQPLSSNAVEDAYRAMMEPDDEAEDTPARTPGRQAADSDQAPRAAGSAPPSATDNTARAAAMVPQPQSVAAAALSSPALVAANANAPLPRGAAARPAGHAPRSEPPPISLWTISVVTGAVSAVTATIMVLLLR